MNKTPAKPLKKKSARIVGEDGQFHVTDQAVDLSKVTFEGWISLGFFWVLGATVFHQFFTRYVLNDSASWTEEIARYLLIATVFVGASVGVARNNHIQVDVLYRVLPKTAGRALSTLVDVLRVLFFGTCVVLTAMLMKVMGNYQMTIIDLPMNILYGICLFGFVCMTGRAAWLSVEHWKQGFSGLEQPHILNEA